MAQSTITPAADRCRKLLASLHVLFNLLLRRYPSTDIVPAEMPRLSLSPLVWTVLAAGISGNGTAPAAPATLRSDTVLERDIRTGEFHGFVVELAADAVLRLVVEQQAADVVVMVTAPSGKVLTVDRPSVRFGPEILTLRDAAAGVYEVELRSKSLGRYRVSVATTPPEDGAADDRLAAELAETAGAELSHRGTADTFRRAAARYEEARALWQALGEPRHEARALLSAGVLYGRLGETGKGLGLLERAVPLWQAAGDVHGEADTWNLIGYQSWLRDAYPEAVAAYRKALDLRRASGDRCGQAQTTSNVGLLRNRRGQPRRALESYLEALDLCRDGQDPGLEASMLTNVGGVYETLGDLEQALDYYATALPLLDRPDQRRTAAVVLNNMGQAHRRLGRYQDAFDHYHHALDILREVGDERRQAVLLNSIGFAYLRMGEPEEALTRFREALPLRRAVEDRRGEAVTLNNLGQVYQRLGNPALALDFYRQALDLRRAVDDRRGEAVTLDHMGTLHAGLGETTAADRVLRLALERYRNVGDLRGEARTLRHLAGVRLEQAEPRAAAELVREALALHRRVSDRVGEAGTLRVLARAERGLGDLGRSRDHLDAALAIVEALRAEIRDPDLRATFLADERGAYEETVDLLMELHRREPGAGHDRSAFDVAEKARARSLLELLAESRTEGRLADLDDWDRPPELGELQSLLDDTLLLEYALGEGRSFVWAVTAESFQAFELPARGAVEAAVRDLYGAWSTLDVRRRDAEVRTAAALSHMLLGPVGPLLEKSWLEEDRLEEGRRLAVVADGALHYVPFGALPSPGGPPGEPLVVRHEIVALPSAAVLAFQRRHATEPASRTVTVLADPIFDRRDSRVRAEADDRPGRDHGGTRLRPDPLAGLPRLPATRREASAIASVVPPGDVVLLLDGGARRAAVTGGRLSASRIVHFATHGVVDSRRPERSGLVLSRYDEQGDSLDGFLSLRDIYALRLDADLVVLSGCRTALGREIRGEGLMGLSRGFLYAGASRVVASLWQVQEQATAELMERFYRALAAEQTSPSTALRRAQVKMWRESDYRDPYHWAAFVHLGDWK